MTSAFESVEEVHMLLLHEAADWANREYQVRDQTGEAPGEIFAPNPLASEKGGLCLTLDPAFVATRTPVQLEDLHELGSEAIQRALADHRDIFVGLIVGEARQGRNYFDRFNSDPQLRLF